MPSLRDLYSVEDGKIVLNLHPGQAKAWDATARFVWMLAGTQSGKTSFGPWWLWREIQRGGQGDYLAVTSTYRLFQLKMLPEMVKIFTRILGIGRLHAGSGVIELKNPETNEFQAKRSSDEMWGRIILRSAASEEGLESATAKAAWLDEVGQDGFSLTAWEAVQRRLSLNEGRVLGTTTLYNLGWLKHAVYDRFIAGDPDHSVIQFASIFNPLFPVAEFLRAKRTMPAWKFAMFYLGEYKRPAGLIYRAFDDRRHKVAPFAVPSHWQRYEGIDFGGVNTAILWIALEPSTKRFYLYKAKMDGTKTSQEHARALLEEDSGLNVVSRIGGNPSEGQSRLDWATGGVHLDPPPFGDVESGIDKVIGLFKQDRLFIFDTCLDLLDELGRYSRKLDENSEPLKDIVNKSTYHLLDALRYCVSSIEGVVGWDDIKVSDDSELSNPWSAEVMTGKRESAEARSYW